MIPVGTPLYGLKMKSTGTPEETIILRAGILDDISILNGHTPKAEIYTDGRVSWIRPTEGADQFIGMPPLP
jgi:hypothetical protein